MRLRQLQHFEAVYRLRSFTRAAEEQFLTQPALSRSIRQLEAELGHQLFDRTTHVVEPTGVARSLIVHVADVLTSVAALEERAAVLHGGDLGAVRAGAGPYPSEPLMTGVVQRLSTDHPTLRLSLTTGSTTDLMAALGRRELDLVVCDTSKISDSAVADKVSVIRLAPEPLVFVVGAGHPLTAGEPTDRDFGRFPWALPPPAPLGRAGLGPLFGGKVPDPFPFYELASTRACLDVVRDDRSVTLVPLSLVLDAGSTPGLTFRLARTRDRTNDGIHTLRRTPSASVELAIEAVVRHAEEQAARAAAWVRAAGRGWQVGPVPS